MKQLIALLSLVFLLGCGPSVPPSPDYTQVTHTQVRNFLFVTNNVFVVADFYKFEDRSYAVPTLKWINEVYTPAFTKWLIDNGVTSEVKPNGGYSLEDNDCEDFSDYAITVGRLLHRKNSNRPINTAIPIGIISYQTSNTDWHAINVMIVMDNGKMTLMFYEPQIQNFIKFDASEMGLDFLKI